MDCIFCKIANKEIESKILYEDETLIVIMDIDPAVDGHALIIPKKHYTDYQELDSNILNHIFDVAKMIGPKIMGSLDKNAITLLINYGDDQQVKHFHMHLLPEFNKVVTKKPKLNTSETYIQIKKNL